jgi:hypothetical protein
MKQQDTTMQKTILAAFGAMLIAASTVQVSAAEHRPVRKAHRAAVSEQVRNANNAIAAPSQPIWYSGGYSAPAGH